MHGSQISLVAVWLMKYYGTGVGSDLRDPIPTVTSKSRFASVCAFLEKYCPTDHTGGFFEASGGLPDRRGIVSIGGEDYQIVDIGMRMLSARELARAQGFADAYTQAPVFDDKPLAQRIKPQ